MTEGIIYNIQRFSIFDGPGIRTTVFFKGCNLACKWCHNPESISSLVQLEFYADKCIGCGKCFENCPASAHSLDGEGNHIIDREKCVRCGSCAYNCFSEAIKSVGETMTSDSLFKAVMTDVPYYERSGGGVTFSGGECMQQIEFLEENVKLLRAAGVHVAIDTAGNQPWEKFERLIKAGADMYLYDVKAASAEKHRELTGAPNGLILENLRRLVSLGQRIWIRVPFIPGYNDGELEGIKKIIAPLSVERVEIMPYHRLGEGKYKALGIKPRAEAARVPENAELDAAVNLFREAGINAFKS